MPYTRFNPFLLSNQTILPGYNAVPRHNFGASALPIPVPSSVRTQPPAGILRTAPPLIHRPQRYLPVPAPTRGCAAQNGPDTAPPRKVPTPIQPAVSYRSVGQQQGRHRRRQAQRQGPFYNRFHTIPPLFSHQFIAAALRQLHQSDCSKRPCFCRYLFFSPLLCTKLQHGKIVKNSQLPQPVKKEVQNHDGKRKTGRRPAL